MSRLAISISVAECDPRSPSAERCADRGIALIVVLLALTLLSALGLALTLTTSTETRVAAAYEWSTETFYAADTGIERALQDLTLVTDWTEVLGGLSTSSFVDGAPGVRTLPEGWRLDLNQETDRLNCGHPSCSTTEMIANTADRPWGANNPIWRLYAYGPIRALSPSASSDTHGYVIVWVSDDPLETDGQPLIDGSETAGANPGRGVLQLRAQAYGSAGALRIVEATLRRGTATRLRMLSWREVRQ